MKCGRICKKPVWQCSEGEGMEAPDEAEEVAKVYSPVAILGGEQDMPPSIVQMEKQGGK